MANRVDDKHQAATFLVGPKKFKRDFHPIRNVVHKAIRLLPSVRVSFRTVGSFFPSRLLFDFFLRLCIHLVVVGLALWMGTQTAAMTGNMQLSTAYILTGKRCRKRWSQSIEEEQIKPRDVAK